MLGRLVPVVARGSLEQLLGRGLSALNLLDVLFAFLVDDHLAAAQFLLAVEQGSLEVAVVFIAFISI